MQRYQLPAPQAAPTRNRLRRFGSFLSRTWRGRILLGAASLYLLDVLGASPVRRLGTLAALVLWLYAFWGVVRLGRFLVRRLLWRIRTKLIVSYLFVAVVPVVLLGAFFCIAGLFFSGLVASYLVTSEVERSGQVMGNVARSILSDLPHDDQALAAILRAQLDAARAIHPHLSYSLVRRGKTIAASGDAPRQLPSWWKGPEFRGLVTVENGEVLRVVFSQDDALLAFDAPVDGQLFASLEKRTGIQFLSTGGRVETRGREVQIEVDDEKVQARAESRQISGMPFVSILDTTDWTTGKQEQEPLTFSFRPRQLVSQLSPGSLNMADVLVKALTAVGAVFLVMYCFALLLGLLLARSVTRSVHALSRGTERLQSGDFSHRIQVRSRDQLGELAESFNMMARGIEDLLRQQAEKERLEEELRIARQIQMSLLPAEGAVSLPGLQIAALCLPAAEVGGDYYDLIPLSDTRLGVLVADVSGKGTSAALYMAELKGLVLSLSRIYSSPAALLAEANSILCATLDSRSFITMTYAVVDSTARTMRYARAGHNPIVHLEAKTGRTRVLTPPGLGLGLDRGERFAEVLEEAEVPLTSGDTFLFFTDGLSEAMNQRSELFGERRLRDVVESGDGLGSEELKQRILEEIRAFADGASQHDDMTMVILKVV